MGDETDTTGDDTADRDTEPERDADGLGDAGRRALSKERSERRRAEKELAAATARLREIENAGKSELEQEREGRTAAEQRAADAETRLLRLEVAAEYGLTPGQARRLVGTTREELEADAQSEDFAGTKPTAPVGGTRPRENLRGGREPDEEPVETDPRKLIAQHPRQ